MANTKSSGTKVSSLAGKTLGSDDASQIQKSLAGSALAQSGTDKTTSKEMETKASAALRRDTAADVTKSLAGSVASQSKK